MLLRAQLALLAAVVASATVLPASAQGFNPEEVKRLNRARSEMPDIGRPYSIRVTTGSSSNAGFERPLVESDPNLKHWCWIPVTNFNQAYIHMGAGQTEKGKTYERPRHVYIRPNHVPLPVVHRTPSQPIVARSRGGSRSNSDVSATLSYAKNPAPRAYSGETKTYSYSDVSGRLSAPRYTAANYSESKDCYGKLVSRTSTH